MHWHTLNLAKVLIQEEAFGLGVPIQYEAPMLILKRPDDQSGDEQKVTFEPRHRFTFGAAGRIDVYSYPAFREAMLLRTPTIANPEKMTWEEVEALVATAPWKALSTERLPLKVDLTDERSIVAFLNDLVA